MKENDSLFLHKTPAKFVAFCGLWSALAIALSALEMAIPAIPLLPPGAKLGLSNIATMYAAGAAGLFPALVIALLKSLFAGMVRGAVAMCMSLAGGLLSTFIMWFLFRHSRFGYIGIGVAGAFCHNAAQLVVAILLTTPVVLWYVPWLILCSVLTGTLTGLLLRMILPFFEKMNESCMIKR